jgi:hypothetical protein
MKFTPKNTARSMDIYYKDYLRNEVKCFKFLGMHIENNMNWINGVEHIFPELSAACLLIRS